MKTAAIILLMFIVSASAELAMYYDGATRSGPRQLPTRATETLDGSKTFSNLQGASWTDRNACGWYEIETTATPDGEHLLYSTWPDSPPFVEQLVTTNEAEWQAEQALLASLPQLSETGYEVGTDGLLVLPTETNKIAVAVAFTDDGDAVIVTAHGSPYTNLPALKLALKQQAEIQKAWRKAEDEYQAAIGVLVDALAIDTKISAATMNAAIAVKVIKDIKPLKPVKPVKP